MPERPAVPPDGLPDWTELRGRHGLPPGSTWGLFGRGNQRGTVNLIGPDAVTHAATLVETGEVFGLDYPLDAFLPSPGGARLPFTHRIVSGSANHRDDLVDSLPLQGGSQVDGLRHVRHPDHGFYGGIEPSSIDVGTPDLGIQVWGETGICGRGVLVDVAGYLEDKGEPIDQATNRAFDVDIVERVLAAQGTQRRPGDLLLIHTGWAEDWLRRVRHDRVVPEETELVAPGIRQSEDWLAWLWDSRVALIAADNPGVECIPAVEDSPFADQLRPDNPSDRMHNSMLHRRLIALLGMVIGELWRLHELAAACRKDGRYAFLLTCKPLNLVGGVGSPANAIAIR